jgi:hypothetical protein
MRREHYHHIRDTLEALGASRVRFAPRRGGSKHDRITFEIGGRAQFDVVSCSPGDDHRAALHAIAGLRRMYRRAAS